MVERNQWDCLKKAYRCANNDLSERLTILYMEARHIQLTTAYLLSESSLINELANEQDPRKERIDSSGISVLKKVIEENKRLNSPCSDTEALAKLMYGAAKQLKKDISSDISQIEKLDKALKELFVGGKDNESARDLFIISARSYLYRQSTLRKRAHIYAQRLGHLQDRLGQELEHVIPDHPSPTILKRQEYGLTDTYLKELSRWVHRDLIILVKDYLKCAYPYENVPTTLQHWEHDYTSHISSFCTDKEHSNWRDWILEGTKSGELGKSNKTIYIQPSYWMLDRPALQPIFGHELAHRVLRDALGHVNVFAIANRKQSGLLGCLARRIVDWIEGWCNTAGIEPLRLAQEILCDLMAASRFGYSYLYAWFLETLASDYESDDQLKDEFSRYDLSDDNIDSAAKSPFPYREDNEPKLPMDYLRGRALLIWFDAMGIKRDRQEEELHQAVKQHLNIWLSSRLTEEVEGDRILWLECASDLKRAIWKVIQAPKAAAKLRLALQCDNEEQISKGRYQDWFMYRQRLSSQTREWIFSFAPKLKEIRDVYLYTITDISWRLEWIGVHASPAFDIALEDYLLRIGHPHRLKALVMPSTESEDASLQLPSFSRSPADTLNGYEHQARWIRERNEVLDDQRCISFMAGGRKEPRVSSTVDGLSMLYCENELAKWFPVNPKSSGRTPDSFLFHMELMVISSPRGGVPLNTHHQIVGGDVEWNRCEEIATSNLGEALLGRFDRFAISNIRLEKQVYWESMIAPPKIHPPYFSRRKQLLRIYSNPKAIDAGRLLIVLVELKSYLFRLSFIRWITSHEDASTIKKRASHIFLSNGWEDVVLILSVDSADNLRKSFEIVRTLHDHPMVKRTESMFSQDAVFSGSSSNGRLGHVIAYHIRVKRDKHAFLNELVAETIKNNFNILWHPVAPNDISITTLIVDHAVGRMDYRIHAPLMPLQGHKQVRKMLYGLTSVDRVECDVSCIVEDPSITNSNSIK